jgi:plastocyanin
MRRILLPVLASTALLAGCGSDSESESTPQDAPSPGAAANQVDMVDLKFEPKSLEVKVGQTVTWVNKDTAPHNVVNEREGQQPKSELFNEGGKYSFTPTKAGRIAYVCTIHPGMEGTLDVVEG